MKKILSRISIITLIVALVLQVLYIEVILLWVHLLVK